MNVNVIDVIFGQNKKNDKSFVFYTGRGETDFSLFSFQDFLTKSYNRASWLRENSQKGDRVLLLLDTSEEFVASFFGCIFSGRIPVPLPKPIYGKHFDRISAIIKDCDPRVAICTEKKHLEPSPHIRVLDLSVKNSDILGKFDESNIESHDIAYLQYTSGSTQRPRGVKISHINLIEQCKILDQALGTAHNACMVSWMPLFHDFGLMMGVVYPMLRGFTSVLMQPTAFVRDPLLWLKAISKWHGTFSGAPNFAFDYCLEKAANSTLNADLNSLVAILNGAEPVRSKSIDLFEKYYANLGLRQNVVRPVYGLAESTLVVSGSSNTNLAIPRLEHEYRTLVSCGKPLNHQIVIADNNTLNPVPEGTPGEVFVQGASSSAGYWNPRDDLGIFDINITGMAGKFIRTGDIGFFKDDELYICGRSKDVFLVRGDSIHACDIEEVAQSSHCWLEGMSGACFSTEFGDEEKIVLLQRISRQSLHADSIKLREVAECILRKISDHCGLLLDQVILIRQDVAKTTSGKIQRSESKRRFLSKEIIPVISLTWSDLAIRASIKSESQGQIADWLMKSLADLLAIPVDSILLDGNFRHMAIPDYYRKIIVDEIHKNFKIVLPISLFEIFPTPRLLIDRIFQSVEHKEKSQNKEFSLVLKQPAATRGPIAIIGMACRFPQAHGVQEFWDLICQGKDAVGSIPPDRWDSESLYSSNPLALAKMNCKKGGFLDAIDGLDRGFFELSTREAIRMDPQHRLIMELGWICFSDAGYSKAKLYGSRVGCFLGISASDYAQEQFGDQLLTDAYAGLGSALVLAPSRLSHFLNLRGPAVAIDTACSSALSAVHTACSSIHLGESYMALAGGVNIILSPAINMSLTKAGMLSPDGKCKAFDESANGYVRSEGAGLVLLKSLDDALRDNDRIYGVIRGSASNHDGQAGGISAPNGESQEAVIKQACHNAGIKPEDIDYFEAHGTGTAIGDPIEANAIGAVIAKKKGLTTIGSVKTNIGHTESAAGIASIIKACLMLRHRQIPASLHFEKPNPLINFERLKIRVPVRCEKFEEKDEPLLIGVNGFGVGGTNVHVVLSEYPVEESVTREQEGIDLGFIMPFSSHSLKTLGTTAAQQAHMLSDTKHPLDYLDLLKTNLCFRDNLSYNAVAYAKTKEELCQSLRDYAAHGFSDQVIMKKRSPQDDGAIKPVFVFSGQGMQWPGMGKYCYDSNRIFRETVDQIDVLSRDRLNFSLSRSISDAHQNSNLFSRTDNAQPIVFALQVALASMWQSFGIVPAAVVGHSMGEVAAAHIAGILSLSDAVDIIIERSLLMHKTCDQGMMANVEMDPHELKELLSSSSHAQIDIAAINSPTSTVLSGSIRDMRLVIDDLKSRDISVIIMPGSYAFHSRLMAPYSDHLSEKN